MRAWRLPVVIRPASSDIDVASGFILTRILMASILNNDRSQNQVQPRYLTSFVETREGAPYCGYCLVSIKVCACRSLL
jgi:hypothetical protein